MSPLLPLLLAAEPPSIMGQIIGGWEYVWAAYGVTWTGIVLYALSLWVRRPKAAS